MSASGGDGRCKGAGKRNPRLKICYCLLCISCSVAVRFITGIVSQKYYRGGHKHTMAWKINVEFEYLVSHSQDRDQGVGLKGGTPDPCFIAVDHSFSCV